MNKTGIAIEVALVLSMNGCVLDTATMQRLQPTAVDFGDSNSLPYAFDARQDLCGSVDLRHTPYNNGGFDCSAMLTPYATAKALHQEANNGCAETELEAMQKEFSGGKHLNVIVFNAGLHDFQSDLSPHGCGQSTPATFHAAVEALAVEAEPHGDIVIWADATPVPAGWWSLPEGIETVINPIGEAIAREHGFYILNWDSSGQKPHDVHYTSAGYRSLGQQLADCIQAALAGNETEKCHR